MRYEIYSVGTNIIKELLKSIPSATALVQFAFT